MPDQLPLPGFDRVCADPDTSPRSPHPLWQYPDCDPVTLQRNAKAIGDAGQFLCDSVAARIGLHSSPAPEGLPYDRIFMVGHRGVRVQVKTTTHARKGAYRFAAEHGYHRAPGGVRAYADDAFDILGLVALPANVIAFTTSKRLSHNIPVQSVGLLRACPQETLRQALLELGFPVPEAPCSAVRAYLRREEMEEVYDDA